MKKWGFIGGTAIALSLIEGTIGLAYHPVDLAGRVQLAATYMAERMANTEILSTETNEEITRHIFIGDSRTVGMSYSVAADPEDIWVAKESMGYDWMVSEGVPFMEELVDEHTAIYILMGVNDLGNAWAYADYINDKAEKWDLKGADTYFISVGPVGQTTVSNDQIEGFNRIIRENAIYYEYLDTYNLFQATGFEAPDGLHYSGNTYIRLYDMIKNW